MTSVNRQITLAARPVGFPKESDFTLVESPIPTPGDGQFLVRVAYVSVDPYMRGRLSDRKSYADPVQLGDVMVGGGVGEVVESKHPDFAKGDIVQGSYGWQAYAVSNGGGDTVRVDPGLAPISTSLGILGMPGLSAYFGLLDICAPKEGETVFVSGAAGAVGSLVGQIAKIKGCYVVGSAGSDEKVEHLVNDLGFDDAFNYKNVEKYHRKLREVCPRGIDVYFDNVGGALTDGVILNLNLFGRISLCGQISQYNLEQTEMGPRMLGVLIGLNAKVEGFIVSRYHARYNEGLEQLSKWMKEGKIQYRENIVEGIENTPAAFIGMLNGQNTGKQLVKVT